MQVYSIDFQDGIDVSGFDHADLRIDFLFFFLEIKALLAETNHIRFLVLPIPIYWLYFLE